MHLLLLCKTFDALVSFERNFQLTPPWLTKRDKLKLLVFNLHSKRFERALGEIPALAEPSIIAFRIGLILLSVFLFRLLVRLLLRLVVSLHLFN